jgi:hypothetical protein
MPAIHPLGGGFRILRRQVARTLAAQGLDGTFAGARSNSPGGTEKVRKALCHEDPAGLAAENPGSLLGRGVGHGGGVHDHG